MSKSVSSRIYVRDKKTGKIEFMDQKGRGINRGEMEEKLNKDGKKFLYMVSLNKDEREKA